MKQLSKYTAIMVMLALFCSVRAQSIERAVIGSTGGYAERSNLQLSATAGETIVSTEESGSFILTQGFQQADTVLTTSIAAIKVNIDYRLYPNPTVDIVNLELSSESTWYAGFSVTDAIGRKIFERFATINGNKQIEIFDLSVLAAGQYFITVTYRGAALKTFNVQKID